MTSSRQSPRDIEELMCLLQTIKDQMQTRETSIESRASTRPHQVPTMQPSDVYGPTNISDHAQAILGNVYFYDRDQEEQKLILQEFREQMERFCRRQDKRDESWQRALNLFTEINQGLPGRGGTSETSHSTISGQELLAMIEPNQERSAEQTLEFCRSIAQRRQLQLTFVKPVAYMSKINEWLNASGSMLLHITTKSSAEDHMSDIIVQLAAILKDSEEPIIWSLPVGSENNDIQVVVYDVVSQLQRLQPNSMIETDFPVKALGKPHQVDLWIKVFRAVLMSIKRAFVVLNFPQQLSLSGQVHKCHSQVLNILQSVVNGAEARGNVVKVLVHTGSMVMTDMLPKVDISDKQIACTVDSVPTNIVLARRSSAHARSLTRQSLLRPVLNIDSQKRTLA